MPSVGHAFTAIEKASQIETVLQGQDYCSYSLNPEKEQKLFKAVGLTQIETTALVWDNGLTLKVINAFDNPATKTEMCKLALQIIKDIGLSK